MNYQLFIKENAIVNHVTFIYLLGMGGLSLDNAMSGGQGATLLRRKVNALKGTYCPALLDYTAGATAAQYIKETNEYEKIMLVGDSCGANRLSWVAAVVHPRPIDYMFAIQASEWCNLGCPPVPDNVKELVNVYGGFITFGLGQFEPPLQVPPTHWDTNTHGLKIGVGNNGKTKVTYKYVNAPHPDDWDVVNVHNPIVDKAKQLITGA